jgi:hypothetical protein
MGRNSAWPRCTWTDSASADRQAGGSLGDGEASHARAGGATDRRPDGWTDGQTAGLDPTADSKGSALDDRARREAEGEAAGATAGGLRADRQNAEAAAWRAALDRDLRRLAELEAVYLREAEPPPLPLWCGHDLNR